MTIFEIIVLIVVGLLAGWLAGLIWRGRGFGIIGNFIIGIIGAVIGRFLFNLFKIPFHSSFNISFGETTFTVSIDLIVAALVGSLILLFIISRIRR
jgi:uncharacterized membrane protein YeaQ/YmgE (transglycosylase-associated protein family)